MAQQVFEITYQFPADAGKTVYRGLLVNKPDGTGFLRLSAINNRTNQRVLYDFSISLNPYDYWNKPMEGGLQLTGPDKTIYWYCWSENYLLKEGTEISNFDYLQCWFRRAANSKLAEPCLETPFSVTGRSFGFGEEPVVSAKQQQGLQSTGLLSFKQLKNTSFTKTYLQNFFTSTELFNAGAYTYKQLLTARNRSKPVLYLLNVINSKDEDISVNCVEDGKKVSGYFKKLTGLLEIPMIEKKLTGNDFNAIAVKSAIKNLRPGKDDIVVFFYSGHGFRWKGDAGYPFPQLGLYYGRPPSWDHMAAFSINLEDIFREIQAKGARLNLVMSDCCNTIVNRRRSEIKDTLLPQIAPGYYDINKRTAMSLLLQSRSSLLISAAEKGQAANCSNSYNGFFTTSIINSIRMGLKASGIAPQWPDIVRKAGVETSELALKYSELQNIIYRVCNIKASMPCTEFVGEKTAQ